MFNLKEQDIIMRISVEKAISNKDVIYNLIGNLLTPAGGDIANKVEITLTKDVLYLQYKGHTSIGYVEEIREEYEINLSELIEFNVVSKENEELITIKSSTENFKFIRNNSENNFLALKMETILKKMK